MGNEVGAGCANCGCLAQQWMAFWCEGLCSIIFAFIIFISVIIQPKLVEWEMLEVNEVSLGLTFGVGDH